VINSLHPAIGIATAGKSADYRRNRSQSLDATLLSRIRVRARMPLQGRRRQLAAPLNWGVDRPAVDS
jgi:hypothetical protein